MTILDRSLASTAMADEMDKRGAGLLDTFEYINH